MFSRNEPIRALPYPMYCWTVVLFALGGLLNAIYLSISHYRVYTDIGYKSFCAISKAINCDTVSQSPYSIYFGVPVPVWGVIGYAFFLLLLIVCHGEKKEDQVRLWSLIILVSSVFCGISAALAVILTEFIHSYCIMCVLSYGINLLLLYYSWLVRRRFKRHGFIAELRQDLNFLWQRKRRTAGVFLPFVAAVMILSQNYPSYWNFIPPVSASQLATGVTEDGHPWVGAETPDIVITEFADYQCFQCKKMHYFLRQIVAGNPTKIRLVHRHFPMDHEYNYIVKDPFHVGSGKMALFALYAATKGRFWEMNDVLFSLAGGKKEIDVRELAKQTGVDYDGLVRALYDPLMRRKLKSDIWKGMKLRITGTPSYLINGKIYEGEIPAELLKSVM